MRLKTGEYFIVTLCKRGAASRVAILQEFLQKEPRD